MTEPTIDPNASRIVKEPTPAFVKWLFGVWWVLLAASVSNAFARAGTRIPTTPNQPLLPTPTQSIIPVTSSDWYFFIIITLQIVTVIIVLLCLLMFFHAKWGAFLRSQNNFTLLVDIMLACAITFAIPLAALNIEGYRYAVVLCSLAWVARTQVTLYSLDKDAKAQQSARARQAAQPLPEPRTTEEAQAREEANKREQAQKSELAEALQVFQDLGKQYGSWWIGFSVVGVVIFLVSLRFQVATYLNDTIPQFLPDIHPSQALTDFAFVFIPLVIALLGFRHLDTKQMRDLLERR